MAEKEEEYGDSPIYSSLTVILLIVDEGPVNLDLGTTVGPSNDRWTVKRKIGEGGCGSVYYVRRLR